MKLLKTSPDKPRTTFRRNKSGAGFTLPEILVALGVLGIVLAFGLFISFDTFRGSSARAERDLIVNVLQKARSRAVANMYACTEHGVRFDATEYVLFRDGTFPCTLTEEGFPANTNYTPTFDPIGTTEIIFDQLTANVSANVTIKVEGGGKCYLIDVNQKGGIDWGATC